MGAIERNGFIFEPEYSVISQKGAIHVYHNGEFIEEIKFEFTGRSPKPDQIETFIHEYFRKNNI
ncbi:YbxH family protein [Bacillus aquiflavi]|uniref:YbxH family protein n=1 Tax=Bacillus aquiflavi TaxID=2672567 RepID=A0A6B3VZ97_9BACI|nr:YbxH family protein [Bacillus aquiflavi]MBA4536539.1 YbxH family protein [Bacillus aquiflavi]NEY80906.1 YbxH family protein [Bacillus aquiflavi]UAC49626.1 YbxH family protein [Bacillus aquiflavi]